MKKLLCTIAALMITGSAFGQGTVIFNNRLPVNQGGDQRIYLGGDSQLRGDALNSMGLPGPGASYTAGLYLVGAGGALTEVITRSFRGPSAAAAFFIDPITVNVTGVDANQSATFRIRAWETSAGSYANAVANQRPAGESNDVLVSALGGTPAGGGLPTADPYLEGLQEFNLFVVPEPSVLTLGVLGAAGLLLRRRK